MQAYRNWAANQQQSLGQGPAVGPAHTPIMANTGARSIAPPVTAAPDINAVYMKELQDRQLKARQQNLELKTQLARSIMVDSSVGTNAAVNAAQGGRGTAATIQPQPIRYTEPQVDISNLKSAVDRSELPNHHLSQQMTNATSPQENQQQRSTHTNKVSDPPIAKPRRDRAAQQPRQKKAQNVEPRAPNRDGDLLRDVSSILAKMNAMVEDNKSTLAANLKAKPETTSNRKNSVKATTDVKQKLAKFLKRSEQQGEMMPLWRHKLKGNPTPPPSLIIKGMRLFRVIARSIIAIHIRPTLQLAKRKLQQRNRKRVDLKKTILGFFDVCSTWVGKIVRLPLISVDHDVSLDFDQSFFSRGNTLSLQAMQLKVRIRAMVSSLLESEPPASHILEFLDLLISDDNFFTKDYLWQSEVDSLEFSSVGATRRVVVAMGDDISSDPLAVPQIGSYLSAIDGGADTSASSKKLNNYGDFVTVDDIANSKSYRFEVTCARMLLRNFIITRVLVGRVLLSPWHCGVCSVPVGQHASRKFRNFRAIASIVYEMQRQSVTVPSFRRLPPVTTTTRAKVWTAILKERAAEQQAEAATAAAVAAASEAAALRGNTGSGKQKKQLVNKTVTTAKGSTAVTPVAIATAANNAGSGGDNGDDLEAPEFKTKHDDDDNPHEEGEEEGEKGKLEGHDGIMMYRQQHLQQQKLGCFGRWVTWLTRSVDDDDQVETEIEKRLTRIRPAIEPLDSLHFYLNEWSDYTALKPLADEWMSEYSQKLDEWVDLLLKKILLHRIEKQNRDAEL